MMGVNELIKLFGMQNLLLESELKKLEESGVQIEHTKTIQKAEIVDVDLFESDILQEARRMADFYVIYYALENSIRRLISERLLEKHGLTWWQDKVPEGVRNEVAKKQKEEMDTIMSIRSEDPLAYTNFGELISIFDANWKDFSDTLRSQKAMQQILAQFNKIRNTVAHSCELNDDEITRFKLSVKDWFRIQS
jgi:energy-converting hydrogenase A subunit M